MASPFSRAAPHPYDCLLDAGDGLGPVGLMLVPSQEGLLVGRTSESLANVSPTEYGYASQDPVEETTFAFGRLVGGMGETTQSSGQSKRYRYALDVDCSIAGMPRLGPKTTVQTLPATLAGNTDVWQTLMGPGAAADRLYTLRGRGVYELVGGVWSLSRDWGVGVYPQQAALFRGTVGTRGMWVSASDGTLYKQDGTGWAAAVLPAGPGAEFVEAVGDEMYIAAQSTVRVCRTGDPLLAASWGGAIQVGNPSSTITYIKAVGDAVVVFKTDGVYTLTTTADGVESNDLLPELRPQASPTNGRHATPWRDRLRFGYGDSYLFLGADGSFGSFGPERLVDLDPTIAGRAVSGAGHADWFFYLLAYNADVNTTYLHKFGTWMNQDAESGYEFADAWHGAVAHWTGKVGSRLDVVYRDAFPDLWVGFTDGSLEMTALPSGTPDPAGDDRCAFVGTGRCYAPLHHGGFPATMKSWHALAVVGPRLGPSQWAQVVYRPTAADPYQDAGWSWTASGTRVPFPAPAPSGLVLDWALDLHTASSTTTPIVEHLALFEAIRPHAATPPSAPSLRLGWSFTARAADRVARRDGVASPVPAARIRAALRAAATNPGAVSVTLIDESITSLEAVTYAEVLAPDDRRVGLDHAISVRLVAVV